MIRIFSAVFAALILSTLSVQGQWRIGIHGGLNLADLREPDGYEYTGMWLMRPHMLAGIAIDYAISEHVLIAAQINFIQKGMATLNELTGLSEWGYTSFTGNYYEVPICVRWRIGTEPIRWFAECGPEVALLESSRGRYTVLSWWQQKAHTEIGEYSGGFRKTELGLTVGAGGEYNLTGSLVLTFSVHYARGMTEVFNDLWNGVRSEGVQFDCGVLVCL